MLLSERFKSSFKVALALVLAYWVTLSMDWDKAMWASYAVVLISLETAGQSIEKGLMRMLGTLLAAVVSLTLIALFPQDRWWLMVALSAYVGLCTYLMGGTKRQYMWYVAGFVSVIICLESVPATDNAFDIAILRTLETGLGILSYTLVTLLVWPTSTGEAMDKTLRQVAASQHALFRAYVDLLAGRRETADLQPVRMQQTQQLQQLGQVLTGARTDTYEVWEMRRQWERYQGQAEQVMEALERWRESFEEVRPLDLESLMPDYRTLIGELDNRFEQIEQILAGRPPGEAPTTLQLGLDRNEVRVLSHFERAALALFLAQVRSLESLTRAMLGTLAQIKGFASPGPLPVPPAQSPRPTLLRIPDTDRLGAAVQMMATLWLAYLVWLYVEIPGGVGSVIIAGAWGMGFAMQPQVPMRLLFKPLALAVACSAVAYIFLMPRLSSFVGLGTLIFLVTFAFGYLFHEPRQNLARIAGILGFTTMAGISNEQTYSFLSLADTALMMLLGVGFIALGRLVPFSLQPHKAYLRLVRRFLRSCEYLSAKLLRDPGQPLDWLARARDAFHLSELSTLPAKITRWADAIPPESLGGTKPEHLQALTTNILALSYRMRETFEARTEFPPITESELVVGGDLQREIDTWRSALREIFRRLALDPDAGDVAGFRAGLDGKLQVLETQIGQTLNRADQVRLSAEREAGAYRLLGAHRGLSEAVIAFATAAGTVDWPRLREERF